MEYGNAVIVDGLASQMLEPDTSVIYDREIALKLLYRDPKTGAPHYLIRYPAGLGSKPHRHTAAHTIVVLEGRMEVNGQAVGPGAYSHFPAGVVMRHEPADGQSCLFVIMFDGPLDAEPVVE
ncbi:MAG: cupin domain-containing protein [Acidimicrobiaceae bacterium]|nr:cupin domain-containing protein [Acidimicrobiaceae bacterium]